MWTPRQTQEADKINAQLRSTAARTVLRETRSEYPRDSKHRTHIIRRDAALSLAGFGAEVCADFWAFDSMRREPRPQTLQAQRVVDGNTQKQKCGGCPGRLR